MPCRDRACRSDALSALDAWAAARAAPGGHVYPGFGGLGLDASRPSRHNSPGVIRGWDAGPEVQYFPEGNHALVRMMIGRMIPGLADARDRFDYGRLDLAANRVRVRLSSPVVLARNDGADGAASSATVGYFDGERVRTVRAGAVVMACRHGVIPYLVPDLPPDQGAALRQAVRAPVVYTTVQLRHWRCWQRAGVGRVRFTGAYWAHAELSPRAREGAADPDEPINVHLLHVAAKPGMTPRDGAAAGRRELIATPYGYLEYSVREQLARLLGRHGFDPARDIEGLTVNRWGHGRALDYAPRDGPSSGPGPAESARRRFGRIAIAGSDSVPDASADAAITSACRAVDELQPPGS
jgi:spermidine dehydrogenase